MMKKCKGKKGESVWGGLTEEKDGESLRTSEIEKKIQVRLGGILEHE